MLKTRIAPTPSGFSHLGNVLSFAITAALAKRYGAKILLRIDNMDRDRVHKEYVQDIFDTLHFLGIPWDEGPRNFAEFEASYSQFHRMEMYRQGLEQLKEKGRVFACVCSRSQILRDSSNGLYPGTCRDKKISFEREDICWRLKTDEERELAVKVLAPEEPVSASILQQRLPETMQYVIVRRKDRFPAYQLTSLLDDLYYGVDLIIRGQDLWDSTLAQHYLSFSLGQDRFRDIAFYHHSLLMGSSHQKLSKSSGDPSVYYLRQQGLKPAEIYSRIARSLGKQERVGGWEELVEVLGI